MVNCSYNAEHPWISMSNEEVLRSGQMIAVDPETGKEGLTLAAILLFGKRNTIAGVQNEKLEWTKLWDQLGLSKGLSKGLSNEQIGLFFESLMKPVAASKLRVILGYTNATKFKNSYIVPLMEQGLVVMSQPDKPNSPTQKYYLTEKGKRVIGSVGAGV